MGIREPIGLIGVQGGYRKLKSYQTAEIVHDFTVEFVKRYIPKNSRTQDQMEQAARSGKQNIAEASKASGTSSKTELKLTNVARASLEELLLDFEDYLRQHGLRQWSKNEPLAQEIRHMSYLSNRSYTTYATYMTDGERAANCALCLIHQANYLLDQQLKFLEKKFLEEGGFSERLYWARQAKKGR